MNDSAKCECGKPKCVIRRELKSAVYTSNLPIAERNPLVCHGGEWCHAPAAAPVTSGERTFNPITKHHTWCALRSGATTGAACSCSCPIPTSRADEVREDLTFAPVTAIAARLARLLDEHDALNARLKVVERLLGITDDGGGE